MAEENDVFEVELCGDLQGQPIINIFHYLRNTIGASPCTAEVLAQQWETLFGAEWLAIFPDEYVLQAVRAQKIWNGNTGMSERLPPFQELVGSNGTRIGEANPAMNTTWVSYTSIVSPPDTWFQGGSQLACGNESDITNGQIVGSLITDIQTFLDFLPVGFTPVGCDDVLTWCIFSKTNAAKPPPQTVALEIASTEIRLNRSTQIRRRRGTSRGGFQP